MLFCYPASKGPSIADQTALCRYIYAFNSNPRVYVGCNEQWICQVTCHLCIRIRNRLSSFGWSSVCWSPFACPLDHAYTNCICTVCPFFHPPQSRAGINHCSLDCGIASAIRNASTVHTIRFQNKNFKLVRLYPQRRLHWHPADLSADCGEQIRYSLLKALSLSLSLSLALSHVDEKSRR